MPSSRGPASRRGRCGLFATRRRGGGPEVVAHRNAHWQGHRQLMVRPAAGASDPSWYRRWCSRVVLASSGARGVRIDAPHWPRPAPLPVPVTRRSFSSPDGDVWAAAAKRFSFVRSTPAVNRIAARVDVARAGWSAMDVAGGIGLGHGRARTDVVSVNADDASVEAHRPWPPAPEPHRGQVALFVAAGGRPLTRTTSAQGEDHDCPGRFAEPRSLPRRADYGTAAAHEPQLPDAVLGQRGPVAVETEDLTMDPAFGTRHDLGAVAVCNARDRQLPEAAGAPGASTSEAQSRAPVRSADGQHLHVPVRSGLRFAPPSGAVLDAAAVGERSALSLRHAARATFAGSLDDGDVRRAGASTTAARPMSVGWLRARSTLSITITNRPATYLPHCDAVF